MQCYYFSCKDILHNDFNEILHQFINFYCCNVCPWAVILSAVHLQEELSSLYSRLDKAISLGHSSHSPFPHPWPSWWPPRTHSSLLFSGDPRTGHSTPDDVSQLTKRGQTPFMKCRRIVQKLKALGQKNLHLAWPEESVREIISWSTLF